MSISYLNKVKAHAPDTKFSLWRSEHLFNIDFAAYTLSHHSFPRHFHDHYVIELVLKGADRFYCDGKNYTAFNNQLVLINPGEVHTGSTIGDIPLQYFSFYPDKSNLLQVAEGLGIEIKGDFNFHQSLTRNPLLSAKLRFLYDVLCTSSTILQQQTAFFDCMRELLGQQEIRLKQPARKDPRINLLIDYIRLHFKEDISLQQMAEQVRLNAFHLTRLFKKMTGISPYEYMLVLRTEHAKQLLRKGYQVQDAAIQSGFYDTSHLNRSLRKMAATSPKSFLSSKSQYRTIFSR